MSIKLRPSGCVVDDDPLVMFFSALESFTTKCAQIVDMLMYVFM